MEVTTINKILANKRILPQIKEVHFAITNDTNIIEFYKNLSENNLGV